MSKRSVTRLRYILLVSVALFAAFAFGRPLWKFSVEDRIHSTFYPVVRALKRHSEKHGNAPERLQDLCPDYLDAIPSSFLVGEVDYDTTERREGWRLTLSSRATGNRRFYIAQEGMTLSETEKRDVVLRYHSCWSIREPQ
jgi:hypothetical protein